MEDKAISPVVGMIMVLAIIAGFMSIIQTQQLPQWNKQKEAEHYKLLVSEFSRIPYILSTGTTASISLDAGLDYPDIPLLINPPDAVSTLKFEKREIYVYSPYVVLPNKSRIKFERTFESYAIELIPHYFYSPKRKLVMEHGVVFEKWEGSDEPIPITDQMVFTNSRVNLFILNSSEKSITAEKFNLKLSPTSYGGEFVTKDVTIITFETEFPEWWYEKLSKIYYVTKTNNSVTVFIGEPILDISSYVIGMSNVSSVQRELEMLVPFHSKVVASVGGVERIDVQAVDSFGNPISGLIVNATVEPSTLGEITQSATTDLRGIASFYFTAKNSGSGYVNLSATHGKTRNASVSVDVLPSDVAIGIIGIRGSGGCMGCCGGSGNNEVTFKHFGGSSLSITTTVTLYVSGIKVGDKTLEECLDANAKLDGKFSEGEEGVFNTTSSISNGDIITLVFTDQAGRTITETTATYSK